MAFPSLQNAERDKTNYNVAVVINLCDILKDKNFDLDLSPWLEDGFLFKRTNGEKFRNGPHFLIVHSKSKKLDFEPGGSYSTEGLIFTRENLTR